MRRECIEHAHFPREKILTAVKSDLADSHEHIHATNATVVTRLITGAFAV
jgi:hypothetical protein